MCFLVALALLVWPESLVRAQVCVAPFLGFWIRFAASMVLGRGNLPLRSGSRAAAIPSYGDTVGVGRDDATTTRFHLLFLAGGCVMAPPGAAGSLFKRSRLDRCRF